MKRGKLSCILFIIVMSIFPLTANGQKHQCGRHSTDWHQHDRDGYWFSEWKIVKWNPKPVYSTKIKKLEEGYERLLMRYHTNEDCEPSEISVATTQTVTHSVTVSGEYEVGGSLEFAADLAFAEAKTQVHAKVTFAGSYEESNEEKVEISAKKVVAPCKKVYYFYDRFKRKRRVFVDAADVEFTCKDFYTGKTKTFTSNRSTLVADGVGWTDISDGWRFVRFVCSCEGDVVVPLPLPDGVVQEEAPTPAVKRVPATAVEETRIPAGSDLGER